MSTATPPSDSLPGPSTADLAALAEHGFRLILEQQDRSGAYPASPTFSAYRGYSWFRDGAFIADGVSAYGGVESASRFFDWCARVVEQRREQIEEIAAASAAGHPVPDERMLATRFTLDGAEGQDEWWDFQLDGYGTWLWAVVEHAERHGLELAPWRPAIELTVDYLLSSWQRPCFDWWEEHAEQVHVSTLGCIAAGLAAAARSGVLDRDLAARAEQGASDARRLIESEGTTAGHLAKWLGSTEVDASLASLIAPLGVFPAGDPLAAATATALAAQLSVDGGVHRYLADTFFGGGQWPLLSGFLGLAELALGDREAALARLHWMAATADAAGDLPEQVAGHLLDPSFEQEWIDRWGPSARPLLWTHAMFLRLAVELDAVAPVSDPAGIVPTVITEETR